MILNGANHPFFDVFFKYLTYLGDGMFCLIIFIVLLFRKYRYSTDYLIIFLLTGFFVQLGKRLLFPDELRPLGELGSEAINLISGVDLHERNSFPSGHTATGVSTFLFIAVLSPRLFQKILLILTGLLVGYSRIYIGQHFLSDVLAGTFIAVLAVYTWLWISNRIRWSPKLEGRIGV